MGGSDSPVWLFPAIVAVIAAVVAVVAYYSAKSDARAKEERRKELAAFAERHKFELSTAPNGGCSWGGLFSNESAPGGEEVMTRLAHFKPFGVGTGCRVTNLVRGPVGSYTFTVMDYSYVVSSGKSSTTYQCGVASMRFPMFLQRIVIRPEGFLDHLGEAIGIGRIHFESDEFNRRYRVTCEDEKFAFDVITPAMIEYLMGLPCRCRQIDGDTMVVFSSDGFYGIPEIEDSIAEMSKFLELIPDFVRQDRRAGG